MAARRTRLLAAAGFLLSVGSMLSSRASAHASPHVLDILFRPDGYVLITNRGLIFGDAARTDWRLMCTEVFEINPSERPSLVATEDGRLLAGTSRGLSSSDDRGCSWRGVVPFAQTSIPALIADPSSSTRYFLAAYTSAARDLGGLYRSDDAGLHWQKLRAADERDYLRSIRVAPSDPMRIYATGQSWDESGAYTYYLLRSRDGGSSWERTLFELEADEREVELLAVSPIDPAVIALRVATNSPASNPERLLISRDAGSTFTSPLSLTLLSALAFSADGTRAWVAAQAGLFESSDGAATFSRVGPAESMSYVAERDGELFAGGYYLGIGTGANGVGTTRGEPTRFDSFMELTDVTAPIDCDAESLTAMRCGPWWLDWERELMLGDFSPDAGARAGRGGAPAAGSGGSAAEGGAANGGSSPSGAGRPPPKAERGCRAVVRARPASPGLLVAGLLGAAWWARRRRAATQAT